MTDTYTAAEMLDELEDAWAFDSGQQHLHTWHDKRDFIDKWRKRLRSSPAPAPPRVPTDEDRGKRVRAWDMTIGGPENSEAFAEIEGVLRIRSKEQGFYVEDKDGHIHQRSHAVLIDPPAEPDSEQKMQDAVSAVLGEPAGKVRQPRFGSATPLSAAKPVWRVATEADDGFVGGIALQDDGGRMYPARGLLVYRQALGFAVSVMESDKPVEGGWFPHARILAKPVDAGEGKG